MVDERRKDNREGRFKCGLKRHVEWECPNKRNLPIDADFGERDNLEAMDDEGTDPLKVMTRLNIDDLEEVKEDMFYLLVARHILSVPKKITKGSPEEDFKFLDLSLLWNRYKETYY